MADVRQRAPPILYYTGISIVLLGVVVARALDRYQNFFAAAFALSHSNGSILVMANMGILCLYLFGRAIQLIFFGPLRPVEVERLYQRGGFFVTDFMLAFATFREAFGVSSGVLVAILLFIKCFHWLLSDRIEAIDQLPYPGPSRLEHARLIALFLTLWVVDLVLLTYSIDAAMQQGMGLIVLFATEYAILMVNLTQCLLKYILSLFEIRRAAALGGPLAPSWEEKPIYGFYIELSTTFIELLIYVTYFATMSVFHSIPVYAIRDVYVSGSLFFSRTLAFIRYKRALRALDVFPTPTHEELESKSDRTCIVCREELTLPTPERPAANAEGQSGQNGTPSAADEPDMSNGPPKRLPCGHIFHLNCLRSWFERQLTCPTCRTRVDESQARGPNAAGGIGRVEGLQGNQGGDNARPQQPGVPNDGPDADRARQGAQNRNGGRHGDGAANPAVQIREPLRFEGFYLQPGAYVPWVGGPIIPRDPTVSTAQQLQRIANGLQQRPRHTPLPSTSSTVNYVQPFTHPGSSATPVPPAVQSPTSALNPGSTNLPQTWPTATAASSASPIPEKIIKPGGTPKRSSVALASDGETSSEESSEENSQTFHERRRLMAEAALRRHQASFSRLHSTASNPGTPPRPSSSIMPLSPADHSSIKSPTEQAYNKYFGLSPQEPTSSEGTTPTQPWKPFVSNPLRAQTAPTPSIGQYTVRNDAPSFIPLFHQFHIPAYGPATGTVRAWPLQSTNLPSQTLPMPPTQNMSTPAMTRPGSYRDSRSPSITANLPQATQHPNSSINPSLLRASSSLPPRDIKREASPTQELSLRQLDSITRQLVEERLRVLENVKRMTQQCIDELIAVRGSAVGLESLRPGQTSSKPLTEQDSGSSEAVGGLAGNSVESTPLLAPLLSPTSKADDLLMTDIPRSLEPIQSPGVIPPTPLDPLESLLASKELERPEEAAEPLTAGEDQVKIKEESE